MYDFLQPTTLSEAVTHLKEKVGIRILGGGTDLIIAIRAGLIDCNYIMDCKKIPELRKIEMTDKGLEIGGAVTCSEILASDLVVGPYDVIKQGASTLANVLLRNRATMVGNLCNASPVADTAPPALVLGGYLVAESPESQREIFLKDFFKGPKKHALNENEIVVKAVFPKIEGEGIFLKKQRIEGHDLAQVNVAGFLTSDGKLSLAFGAVGPIPLFIEDAGTYKAKAELASAKKELIAKAAETVSPIGDTRSSKEYRQAMSEYFTGLIVDKLSQEGA